MRIHLDTAPARTAFTLSVALVALLVPRGILAQESAGTPAARAAFAQGKAAFDQKKYDVAAEAYRQAIEADPAYADAHDEFVFVWRSFLGVNDQAATVARLDATYEAWIKADPKQAGYYWGLGWANYYKDPAKAEQYCRKAVDVDPRFARAWQTLSLLAEMKGDNATSRECLRKAVEANPKDAAYLFYYARRVRDDNPDLGTKLSLQVVEMFPGNERAAQALYWLGVDAESISDKLRYFERLRREFAPERFSWSQSGMSELYDVYAGTDPVKAVALARDMVKVLPADKAWPQRVTAEENITQARALAGQKKTADALTLLNATKGINAVRLALLKAEVQAAGAGAASAYEVLAPEVAKQPTEATYQALLKYGAAAKRARADVDADLAARREKTATPAEPFTLPTYDGRTVSLADYRGKVVLLNFWYPG